MGGHIECYLDLASYYSYLGFNYLLKNREALLAYGVTVEFTPVFLGGINQGSGNKPPWSLPAKANYGAFDADRAKKYHGLEKISTPPFFPLWKETLVPQRSLCYVKEHFSRDVFEQTWIHLFHRMWSEHVNITVLELLTESLEQTRFFSKSEIETIVKAASEQEWKDKLSANTKLVLERGAFGAPWHWVRNGEGKEEPFFGSDRYHFMWTFLGVPYQDIAIIPKEKAKL